MLAALLALTAQIALGAVAPQVELRLAAANSVAAALNAAPICHTDEAGNAAPGQRPSHSNDCLACPLCASAHAPAFVLVVPPVAIPAPPETLTARSELPPPATAPPIVDWTPNQPRAPPALS
jgi:hypothetical protein